MLSSYTHEYNEHGINRERVTFRIIAASKEKKKKERKYKKIVRLCCLSGRRYNIYRVKGFSL